MGAWLAVSGIALGRVVGGWQARRAAIYSSVSFAAVVVLYVAFRFAESNGGRALPVSGFPILVEGSAIACWSSAAARSPRARRRC